MSRRRTRAAGTLLLLVLAVAGCTDGEDAAAPAPTPASADPAMTVDSQFTRDGTFQSHLDAKGAPDVDFVYTLYPTKSTPRTNEWYPKGNKFFSFTLQAYDLARKLRDPFATKRKVYLDRIEVTSRTITAEGGRTQHPYRLEGEASELTFDPEPVTTRYGMLVTSPKGAFELRNQKIGPMSDDTRGLELVFTATVHIQAEVGTKRYLERKVRQVVPITIFASDTPTKVAKIPVNAN